MTAWRPHLPELPGDPTPIYQRIIAALEQDVRAGTLAPDTRLPTHRDLAALLGVGVGTVTKAYAEAEARGLVTARVGRGSFVAPLAVGRPRPAGEPINFSRNFPPRGPATARLPDTMTKLRRRPDLLDHLDYAPPAGFEAHRRAGADWLMRTSGWANLDWRRLICCGGSQQAMSLALGAVCAAGDIIAAEQSTYWGMKALAAQIGCPLHGVEMDGEGILPEALDRAAQAGARALYVIPTLQNPTGRIMGAERRAQVVEIARARDLWIIEDDLYAAYAQGLGIIPLAQLAPERTFHVSGLSKTIAPGLRAGYLIPPQGEMFDRVIRAVRGLYYAPSSFGDLIAVQWIEDGTADTILAEVLAKMRERTALALGMLGAHAAPPAGPNVMHLWLPMSEPAAERAAARALRAGVEITPPSAPLIDGADTGLRLCLGGPPDRASLEAGLKAVVEALAAGADRTLDLV